MDKIPITKLDFSGNELKYLKEVLDSGWVVQGPKVSAFEANVAQIVGVKNAVAVNSCTSALHLSLLALGVGPGDEIIVPSFTFIATANSVEHVGATPIFCDIDLSTFNINVTEIEERISERTKGIIPVHQFGLCADMEGVARLAEKNRLVVVEDAACALGSRIDDRVAGSFGATGCFSFHPKKLVNSGEGGMITTDDVGLSELFRSLRDHGASKSDLDRHGSKGSSLLPEYYRVGYNFRMTDIEAAVGLGQIERFDELLSRRRDIAEYYHTLLEGNGLFTTPKTPSNYFHTYQSFALLYHNGIGIEGITLNDVASLNEKRNEFMLRMEEMGVATRQGAQAVHTLDYYAKKYGIVLEDFPKSYMADRLSVSIPIYPDLTRSEQERVVEVLLKCAG